MFKFRWFSVALAALVAPTALSAQSMPFPAIGMATLFGQESVRAAACPCQNVKAVAIIDTDTGTAEELPAPRQCEFNLLPAMVGEFMNCWKDQWRSGNFREAALLASLASKLDPTNLTARHALLLSDLVEKLMEARGPWVLGGGPQGERYEFSLTGNQARPQNDEFFLRAVNNVSSPATCPNCASTCPAQGACTAGNSKAFAIADSTACGCGSNCECCKGVATFLKMLSAMSAPPPALFVSGSLPNPVYPPEPILLNGRFTPFGPVNVQYQGNESSVGMALPVPPTPAQVMRDLEGLRRAAFEQTVPEPQAAPHAVHLVTPQLEAHCQRLSESGDRDHVLLEGNVQLTCKRNGQLIHIQGQYVRVNLAEGTFTVEAPPVARPSAQRVRVSPPPANYFQPATYTAPVSPWGPVRPIKWED